MDEDRAFDPRVIIKIENNYDRIEKMVSSGMTREKALDVLIAELDRELEERYLFEASLGSDSILFPD